MELMLLEFWDPGRRAYIPKCIYIYVCLAGDKGDAQVCLEFN
jgi:hypothetical protein